MKVNKYQDLKVWQKAMDFAEKIYQTTKKFPAEEKFGFVNEDEIKLLLEMSGEIQRMIAGLKKSLLNKITLLFLTIFSF